MQVSSFFLLYKKDEAYQIPMGMLNNSAMTLFYKTPCQTYNLGKVP